MSDKETSNKIDKVVNNVVGEISESKSMQKIFNFLIAAIAGGLSIALTCDLMKKSGLHEFCIVTAIVVGLIVFVSISMFVSTLMKK